jgi:hypothetical protein
LRLQALDKHVQEYQVAAAQLLELLGDHAVEACKHTFGFADAGIAVLSLLLLLLRGRL